jgi:anaerobic selenocysteine-containing dehydrogenase
MAAVNPFDPEEVSNAVSPPRASKEGVTTKKTLCASCDIACSVVAEVKSGRVVKVRSSDNLLFKDNICMKGIVAPKGFAHPDRIKYPLKRVG